MLFSTPSAPSSLSPSSWPGGSFLSSDLLSWEGQHVRSSKISHLDLTGLNTSGCYAMNLWVILKIPKYQKELDSSKPVATIKNKNRNLKFQITPKKDGIFLWFSPIMNTHLDSNVPSPSQWSPQNGYQVSKNYQNL